MGAPGSTPALGRPAKRGWRRHSDEFKSRVIELAQQPHTSVAAVALANGLNANMLRRWVRDADAPAAARSQARVTAMPAFVQLPVPVVATATSLTPIGQAPPSITVEIQRSSTTVRASLPMNAASAAWLREVMG